jgi:hypothetical protein
MYKCTLKLDLWSSTHQDLLARMRISYLVMHVRTHFWCSHEHMNVHECIHNRIHTYVRWGSGSHACADTTTDTCSSYMSVHDRQTDRQTNKQTNRQAKRQTDMHWCTRERETHVPVVTYRRHARCTYHIAEVPRRTCPCPPIVVTRNRVKRDSLARHVWQFERWRVIILHVTCDNLRGEEWRVTILHVTCDNFTRHMWPCYTSHVTMLHVTCDHVTRHMWPCYTSHVTMLHVTCDHVCNFAKDVTQAHTLWYIWTEMHAYIHLHNVTFI